MEETDFKNSLKIYARILSNLPLNFLYKLSWSFSIENSLNVYLLPKHGYQLYSL